MIGDKIKSLSKEINTQTGILYELKKEHVKELKPVEEKIHDLEKTRKLYETANQEIYEYGLLRWFISYLEHDKQLLKTEESDIIVCDFMYKRNHHRGTRQEWAVQFESNPERTGIIDDFLSARERVRYYEKENKT